MRLWKMGYKCLIDTCSQNESGVGPLELAVKTSVIFEKVVISIESKAALGRKWWAWQARRSAPQLLPRHCPRNANANVMWQVQTTGSKHKAAAFLHQLL